MIIRPFNSEKGYALVLVMFFGCISLLVLGGALNSSSTASRILERQKEMARSSTAAEAATEKVIAAMIRDFHRGSEALVQSELNNYQLLVPSTAEDPYWADFQFSNGSGVDNRTGVTQLSRNYSVIHCFFEHGEHFRRFPQNTAKIIWAEISPAVCIF